MGGPWPPLPVTAAPLLIASAAATGTPPTAVAAAGTAAAAAAAAQLAKAAAVSRGAAAALQPVAAAAPAAAVAAKNLQAATTAQRRPRTAWREDHQCGPHWTAWLQQPAAPGSPSGSPAAQVVEVPAECDPEGEFPCCSFQTGWCGNTPSHCDCEEGGDCLDYRQPRTRTCLKLVPRMRTMKSQNKALAVLAALQRVVEQRINGDIVEAGVPRGGSITPRKVSSVRSCLRACHICLRLLRT